MRPCSPGRGADREAEPLAPRRPPPHHLAAVASRRSGAAPRIPRVDAAQHAASGSRDALIIATRNATALVVISAIESWEAFLQGLCDASPERAGQLIAAGAMLVRGTGRYAKPLLGLSLVPGQPGTVKASAYARLLTGGSRKRPNFGWQTSSDGGTTITGSSSTPHAETTFANIPLLSTLYVRVNCTLGKTTGDWSQWVSTLVH